MAPTIARFKNIRFVIQPGDHDPPHVHVYGKGASAKFSLNPVECLENKGFSKQAIGELNREITQLSEMLLEAWNVWQKEEQQNGNSIR